MRFDFTEQGHWVRPCGIMVSGLTSINAESLFALIVALSSYFFFLTHFFCCLLLHDSTLKISGFIMPSETEISFFILIFLFISDAVGTGVGCWEEVRLSTVPCTFGETTRTTTTGPPWGIPAGPSTTSSRFSRGLRAFSFRTSPRVTAEFLCTMHFRDFRVIATHVVRKI